MPGVRKVSTSNRMSVAICAALMAVHTPMLTLSSTSPTRQEEAWRGVGKRRKPKQR